MIESTELEKSNFNISEFCENRKVTLPRFMLSLQEITLTAISGKDGRVNKNQDFDIYSRSSVNSPDKYSSSPIRLSKIPMSEFFISNESKLKEVEKEPSETSLENRYPEFAAFYEQCNTQAGSRIKQKEIERADQEEIHKLIDLLQYDFTAIMIGEYTNYMFTSLIGRCTQAQRLQIIKKIIPNIFKIASHSKGTHPLQTLTALTTSAEEQNIIFEGIQGIIPDMIFVIFQIF